MVGQTGSLPGLPERSHRRNQGKLPVCPTLAPRFSFFQGGATPHESSSEKVGQTGSLPGLPERRIEGVKANCQFALPSRRDFHSFRAARSVMFNSSENGRANWQFAWSSRKAASKESRQTASLPYPRAAIFILSGRRDAS